MDKAAALPLKIKEPNALDMTIGGLRFTIGYRDEHTGTTTRVIGMVDGEWTEILRFDDFIDAAHFHAPANARDENGRAIEVAFDRSTMGVPSDWYVTQIRDHLAEWLVKTGYGQLIPAVDFEEITASIDRISDAMSDCLPDELVRTPGVGLERREAVALG